MKKHILIITILTVSCTMVFSQPNVVPAKPQSKTIAIFGATIHIGNGQVIENGTIVFSKGKITSVTAGKNVPNDDVLAVDATGKHVYPGFIAPITNLGLSELAMVKSTIDTREIGGWNPHVRSIIAYNTDSKVIPVVRANGILMAQVTPAGGIIAGQSSIVQLDAWNWEDAAYKTDDAVHFTWPSSYTINRSSSAEIIAEYEKQINDVQKYVTEAKAYSEIAKPEVFNARFESLRGLFNGKKKVFVRADYSKDIISSVLFFKKFGITPVIVGGADAQTITAFLKENSVPVVLHQAHMIPDYNDDDVYMPAKRAAILQKAGIVYAMSLEFVRDWGYLQLRNLPFEAGVSSAYGVPKEEALSSITLNVAKILGIDKTTGSLEVGKDATMFISGGDALDPLTNDVQQAFIMGKTINLDNLHKQLYKKFSDKYELK